MQDIAGRGEDEQAKRSEQRSVAGTRGGAAAGNLRPSPLGASCHGEATRVGLRRDVLSPHVDDPGIARAVGEVGMVRE